MAINWDSYEKKAKQITNDAKKKSKKTYVGGKSASEVSGNYSKKNKNNSNNKNNNKSKDGSKTNKSTKKTTTSLFPTQKEITKGLGDSAVGIGKIQRENKKAQEKAKKDGLKALKKNTFDKSADEIAKDLGNSIGEMHKQERAAKEKSNNEKYKLKEKQRQAEKKAAEKKLATKSDKQANATANREHRNTATKTGKKQIDSGTKRIIANTKPYAFISATEDELANNTLLGIGYAWANGKKMADGGGQYDAYTTLDNAIKNRTIRKAGEMTGIGGSYLMSYGVAGAAAKAAAATNAGQKAIAKLAGSKLGQASASAAQNTITKLAGTKVGQRIGKETITGVARGAAKDLAGDLTVGTVMNSGQARSLGLEGSDFAKYMGQQALVDLGLGALGDLAPVVYRAIKGTKLAKQAGNIVDAAADGATATAKTADNVAGGVVDAVNEAADGNIKKTQKQRIKEARAAKAKASRESTAKTQHDSLELNKYDEAMSTSEKKSTTRKGEGVKLLKKDSGFNSYMAEKYGDIYSIENVAKKNGQTLSKFLTEEYEAYKFMPDDMKLNYEASESVVADVEAKTGVISDSEKREFSIYLQHKYGDFSNAEAAAKKQGMDMQAFFQKEKALYDQAKAAGKTTADTVEDAVTGETVPNMAKQADGTTVDPETGETIPNTAKATQNTTVDTATGEAIPNTAKAAQEGTEEAVEGAEKSAADAFEEGDLTPESKKKVYDAVQKRTGVKIVEEEFPDEIADSNGYYQDGVIHININSKQPKYTVLKHELTHYMQTSKNYNAFSNFIFDALKRKGFDIDDLRNKKISSYAKSGVNLSKQDADFELVAEYCGEFLFNSQKSIDRLAREHYNLAIWLVDWFKDTIAKIGKSDDAKFLIDAQRKYEYALRKAKSEVNGKRWHMYIQAKFREGIKAKELEKAGKTPEEIKKELNLHRGFSGRWLTEIDDSAAALNKKAFSKLKDGETVRLKELLDHESLWQELSAYGDEFVNDANYKIVMGNMRKGSASVDNVTKTITINKNIQDYEEILSSLLHETQHIMQDKFRLPRGANYDYWYDKLGKEDPKFKEAIDGFAEDFNNMRDNFKALKSMAPEGVDSNFMSADNMFDLEYIDKSLSDYRKALEQKGLMDDVIDTELTETEIYLKKCKDYKDYMLEAPYEAYRNTAGELEAFDVGDRQHLSAEERKSIMPKTKDENTRYVDEDFGFTPTKQDLFVRATNDEAAEATAKESIGNAPDEIKKETNLHRGFNDDWLFETDDSKMTFNNLQLQMAKTGGMTVKLKDLINHDELWKRLDETAPGHNVRNYKIKFEPLASDIMAVTRDSLEEIVFNSKLKWSDKTMAETLLHEIQHVMQSTYNLPNGASPEFYQKFLAHPEKYFHASKATAPRDNHLVKAAEKMLELNDKLADSGVGVRVYGFNDDNFTKGHIRAALGNAKLEIGKLPLDKRNAIYNSELGTLLSDVETSLKYVDQFDRIFSGSQKRNDAKLLAENHYFDTAGELEAFDVEGRYEFDAEGRRNLLPEGKDTSTVHAETFKNMPFTSSSFVRNADGTYSHQVRYYSTGENVIKDPDLKKTSQNLYGEKGNKYLQTASETKATAKAANTELPKNNAKAEDKLPTKSGKKQAAVNGKVKSVSADAKNPEAEMTYEQASRRYETYQNGTPKKLPAKGDVSKAADTIIGSDVIGDEMREAIKENVSNYVKVTKTNRTTIDNVAAKIDSVGLEDSIKNFRNTLAKKNRFNEEDIAMGAEILRRLDDLGDYERALDITDDLVEMMSQAGRTLQAANIFTSMTPYGKLRSIKRAAAKMSERYGKNVEVNEDLMKELFEAKDSAKADKIKQRIFEDLWNQVPSSLMEKLDALRYTAMLSSPKTHIRNILGNAAMYVGKSLSDGVEAALEKTVFKGKMEKLDANRTKSFLNPFSKSDRELKKKAGEIFESVKEQLMNGSSKYIEKGDVRPQNSRIFKSKTLEAGRKVVSGTLEWEDEKFMKANFQAAFAKICKANGLEVGELTAKELRQYTAYAAEQAQAATFRDPNALASAMNKVYRWANDTSKSDAVGKLGRGLVKVTMDATVPFRRTPANILKQAWRYSPGGVAEGLTRCATANTAEELLKGIEILSNGVVGTPIVLVGAYLGYQGIVTGSVGDYSDKKTTYDKMLGDQDYAVNAKKLGELFNVNIGDTTVTMDWLSPYSMPFFVGAELGTTLSNQEGLEGLTATQLVDAMASITEPFLEMSMMQGVQDLITQSYDGNAVEVMATNQMKTYVTQFVPTLLSQIAKTVAEEKTTTKTVNDGTVAGKSFASTIAQLKSKVPGLYETNQPDVDVWGRTETKEDVWDYVRAGVRNILSPANVKDINITDVDKEILSVYDSIDDEKSSVIPTPATSSVEYKGTTYKMTDSQWTDFKKDIGSARYSGLEELFKTKKYKNSSPDIKAKLIKDVYSDALASAKKNFLISSGNMTEEEYNKSNITSKAATKLISSGKTTATKVTEAKGVLEEAGVEKAVLQAYVLDGRYDKNTMRAVGGYTQRGTYKISDSAISRAQAVKKAGLGLTQLQKAYAKADKNGNNTITGEEAENYINKTNYNQPQRHALFAAIVTNPKTHNPY